jgi:two-component sensor histidine kinase
VDTALPIALILNELITNTLKYAFEGREKATLMISLKEMEGTLLLRVKDNGKGFKTVSDEGSNQSFGLKLVHSLANQLKADVTIHSEDGVCVEVKITKYQFA